MEKNSKVLILHKKIQDLYKDIQELKKEDFLRQMSNTMSIGMPIGILTLIPGIVQLLSSDWSIRVYGYFLLSISFLLLVLVPIGYSRANKSKEIDSIKEIDNFIIYNESINTTVGDISSMTTILDILEKISGNIQILNKKMELVTFYINHNIARKLTELIENQIEYSSYIITDLRSDLTLRLTEQQKILESAKSEVESNIKGTTELEQVSELQRARLDRQIEQFEELQRVLVKA